MDVFLIKTDEQDIELKSFFANAVHVDSDFSYFFLWNIFLLISIFRSRHQNIEDHHIDEIIKYYWCISNTQKSKMKKENFNLFMFSLPLLSSQFAEHQNSIQYASFHPLSVSLFFSLLHFFLIFTFLPDWILLMACASLSYWLFYQTHCHLKSNRSWCCY